MRISRAPAVAHPAMGIDWRHLRINDPQFSAQGFDVGVDGAVEAFPSIAPHQLHQLLAGEDATGRVKQRFQQQKFIARQVQRLAEPAYRRRLLVKHKLADANYRRRRGEFLQPPQHAAHPRADFARRKRLGDVIVSADFQPQQLIDLVAPRRQKQHRQRRKARQQAPTELEAADIRQADVEDGHIGRLMRRRLQRGQPAVKDGDTEALLLEHINQGIGDTLFILN